MIRSTHSVSRRSIFETARRDRGARVGEDAHEQPGDRGLVGAVASQAAFSFIVLGLPAIGPQLRQAFALGLPGLGVVLAMAQLGSGVALIAAGIAVDRYGCRGVTVAGVAIATVGLAVGAASATVGPLLIGLFIAGAGGAIIPVAGAVAIFRVYPVERRTWALGVRQMAVPLGGTVAALSIVPLDSWGGTRLVLGVGAVAVGLTGAAFAVLSPPGGAAGGVLRGSFSAMRRVPGVGRLFVVVVLFVAVLQAALSYSVPAVRAAGFSTFEAQATYLVVMVTAMVSRVAWGRIADRERGTRRLRTLVEAGVVATVGALLFGVALHGDIVVVAVTAAVFGFGALGWNAIVYAIVVELTPREFAGRSFAVAATIVFCAAAAVNPVLGALAQVAGWNTFWLVAAALGLIGTMIAATLPRRLLVLAPRALA